MDKLLFIASIQHGEPPTGGGAQAKNQLLLAHFQKHYDVKFFDTWHKNSLVSLLVGVFYAIVTGRKCVLSVSGRGAMGIVKVMRWLHLRRQFYYFVVGGDLGNFVEGHYMKEQLNRAGLSNVSVLPNFKPIGELPEKKMRGDGFVKFVFLGRLIEEKGVGLLIEAAKTLHSRLGGKFSITFYGSPSEKYSQEYFDSLNSDFIEYGGFLNLKSQEGVEKLAEYDVMVFPTFFEGEGFPGVLIDSFKAGLPVIASDFHANPDVIRRDELGTLVKPRDLQSLVEAMETYMSCSQMLGDMAKAVQKEVRNYDIDILLSKENMNQLFDFSKQ